MPTDKKISRRTWLTKVTLLMAAVGVTPKLASAGPTEEKASKSAVHYRDDPQMCGMCKFFEGGGMMGDGMMGGGMMGHAMMMAGQCRVVKGQVSHMGWCDLYAPRGA